MGVIHRLFCLLQRRKTLFATFFLMFAIIFGGRVLAQSGSLPTADDFSSALNATGENLQKFNYRTMLYVAESINCMGGVVGDCYQNSSNAGAGSSASRQSTAFGAGLRYIGYLYQYQPVSGAEFFADVRDRLGFPRSAYAVGSGTQILTPVLMLWRLVRNLCYLIYIIFFIIVGLMIMFRQKVDQQTVLSVQNALPGIVFSLILVTFSYAIAGLMIDISILANNLIINLLSGGPDKFRSFCGGSIDKDCFTTLLYDKGLIVGRPINIFSLITDLNKTDALRGTIDKLLEDLEIPSFGFGSIGALVFTIALIGSIFRTFFALISAYVSIVITTITGPLQLLFTSLPGGKQGFSSYLKSLLSNVLVFPATFMLLLLAAIILGISSAGEQPWKIRTPTGDFGWYPLPLGNLGTGNNLINSLLAFGILLMLPQVPQMVKEAFQVKEKAGVGAGLESFRQAARNIPIIGQFLGG